MQSFLDTISKIPKVTLFLSLCFVAGCQGDVSQPQSSAPARDIEQDTQAVIAAHQELIQAYQSVDAEAFTRLLAPSPDLLIFHPRLENRYDGIEEVKEGLGRMFSRFSKATWSDFHSLVRVEGDVAWLTSQVLIEAPELENPFVGRGTEIWVRMEGGWRLVHGHYSENPEMRKAS